MAKTMGSNELIRIVVTGPESTGKTVLAESLAVHYNTLHIPEFAREYILDIHRKYTLEDVKYIAARQVELEDEYSPGANGLLFYDTYLIVTKVWIEHVFYEKLPWIDEILARRHIHHYLLCYPDIPWEPDPVRENGGEMRMVLFEKYKSELEKHGCGYSVISGRRRFEDAVRIVDNIRNYLR